MSESNEADFNTAFLAEVARLIPDATVVALPPPPPPPTDVPEPVLAKQLAARLAAYAVAQVTVLWRQVLPGAAPPAEIRQRFVAEGTSDRVRAEAAVNTDVDETINSLLDGVPERLRDAGWSGSESDGEGDAVAIRATRGDLSMNLAVTGADGVLAARVVTGTLTVGTVGAELIANPTRAPFQGNG